MIKFITTRTHRATRALFFWLMVSYGLSYLLTSPGNRWETVVTVLTYGNILVFIWLVIQVASGKYYEPNKNVPRDEE